MNDLVLEGKKYISSSRASEISGYDSDYIGQLCRANKLDCRLISRTWFLNENSLREHKKNNGRKKAPSPVVVRSNQQETTPVIHTKKESNEDRKVLVKQKSLSVKTDVVAPIVSSKDIDEKSNLFYTSNQKILLDITKEEIAERRLLEQKRNRVILDNKFFRNGVFALIFGVVITLGILDFNFSLAETRINGGFLNKIAKSVGKVIPDINFNKVLPEIHYGSDIKSGIILVKDSMVETYASVKGKLVNWFDFDERKKIADLKVTDYSFGLEYREFKIPSKVFAVVTDNGVKLSSENFSLDFINSLVHKMVESGIAEYFPDLSPVFYFNNFASGPVNNFVTANHFGNQVNATYNSFETTFGRLTTTDIEEGLNLYFTNERVSSYISASSTLSRASINYWTKTGANLSYINGNVGIGSSTPFAKLSVK